MVEHRINDQGFRGPTVALERTPGVARIACIGDSHTFGEGVGEQETWPAHLARLLAERHPSAPVEVMNCGVDAYDTLQEVLLLERRVLAYAPDLVLLQYYVNDVAARGLTGETGETRESLLVRLAVAAPQGLDRQAAPALVVRRARARQHLPPRRAGLYSDAHGALHADEPRLGARQRSPVPRARPLAERGIAFGVALYPFLLERDGVLTSHAAFEIVAEFCAQPGDPVLGHRERLPRSRDLDALRVSPHDVPRQRRGPTRSSRARWATGSPRAAGSSPSGGPPARRGPVPCSSGTSVRSNQRFSRSQRLLRGLGCGRGMRGR